MASTNADKSNAVLVVGAGIAGMAAAMHLAEHGLPVHLLDTAPAIGGSMHLLDHTFPTNSCGLCLMLPHQPAFCPTFECQQKPNLHLLPYSDLLRLEGEPGAFTATVRHKPRFVDADRCTGCGLCAAVCPQARPHDHEGWLAPVKAIYRPPGLRAVPDTWLIDPTSCTRCGACVTACPTAAIDLDMPPWDEELAAGALLLAPGFAPFDARLKGEYGYRVYDNVLSALEFERLVSLAGSTVAHLKRPSDGQPPHKVAFLHCVGSRDPLCGAGHCSSACCMYTAKQVALAKQIDPNLQVSVFFMDLRAFGKDFEAYIDQVQALPGVTYRRAMPSAVHQLQQSRNLRLTYAAEDGRLSEDTFDLLVLAVGFAPPPGAQELARRLGLDLNDYGFAVTDAYHPSRTRRPGLFVAGAFREPKDIPETVTEAAGAAADLAAFLHETTAQERQRTKGEEPLMPATVRDVADEEPRVGVFVCDCNGDLAALHPAEVVAWAQRLPAVALAQSVPHGCSAEGQAALQAAIVQQRLNRVVLAGCSHRLFPAEFEALMHRTGLDPRLLARVNLREQVLYPHTPPLSPAPTAASGAGNGAHLTEKAQSLVGMAVASLNTMAGLDALARGDRRPLTRRALVVGGGAAGLSAALTLARLDIPVHLVEREPHLGGQWRHLLSQPDGSDPQAALHHLLSEVEADQRVTLHLGAELRALDGTLGHYRSLIAANGQTHTVEHGVLLVATGGHPAPTTEYLYGQQPRVVTQRELEQRLAEPDAHLALDQAKTVVMIQCVGSREPVRPYCSRVCCTQAVKNALRLKALNPTLNVYILYRDVRTYGFREQLYQDARDAGVVFLRYDLPHKPVVSASPIPTQATAGRLWVTLTEPVAGQPLELQADLVVLSVGIDAEPETPLAQTLGVALNASGFFREEHPKMKPLDLKLTPTANAQAARGGLYVAGLAHSPRFLEETIAQAQGAAMRAAAFLAPEVVTDRPTAVWVNERLCSFCRLCVDSCPFQARVMNYETRVADVDYALCQGCGVCAMVCPNKATSQKTFEHKQLMAAIDMALG